VSFSSVAVPNSGALFVFSLSMQKLGVSFLDTPHFSLVQDNRQLRVSRISFFVT
jgi:hypothetical protein